MSTQYTPHQIESKWQSEWQLHQIFHTPVEINQLHSKKYYILDMFPYPSGAGLHVGHLIGYTATDVIARFKRILGYNVLHPMGWDAFGLPTERAAIRENTHPEIISARNINNFKIQIQKLGYSYDWSREINTSDEKYYKWTQWIFSQLYKKGLAYRANVPVNWCPALGTVLANEEVLDNKYIETGDIVIQKEMTQWMLKITHYAESLLHDLETLNWPENIKDIQRNWIGKTDFIYCKCKIKTLNLYLDIFSDSANSIFSDSFISIAYNHPIIQDLIEHTKTPDTIAAFCKNISSNETSGIFSGLFLDDQFTNSNIPIWISNLYTLDYGTGIIRCSSHKENEFQFAKTHNINLKSSIVPIYDYELLINTTTFNSCFKDHLNSITTNSGIFNGHNALHIQPQIINSLKTKKKINHSIGYKLKDWLFSRQRYWGEPFPIVYHNSSNAHLVPENNLPVKLPFLSSYLPSTNKPAPLDNAPQSWLYPNFPNKSYTRETNTMPQWAGSCWYYLRFIDPNNHNEICNKSLSTYWLPVDLYIGGVEHAVLHLLYARFWHKVLFDLKIVSTKEPFLKLFNQGMILCRSYQDSSGKYYFEKEIKNCNHTFCKKTNDEPVFSQIEKMSKSRLNVVNPDEIINKYGADTLRLYVLFMGPLDQIKTWQTNGLEGIYRFLNKIWTLSKKEFSYNSTSLWDLYISTFNTVLSLSLDLKFNIAISKMMIFINALSKEPIFSKEIFLGFLQMLSPFAPHIAEEIWHNLGKTNFISTAPLPFIETQLQINNKFIYTIHLNGKKLGEISIKHHSLNLLKKELKYFLKNHKKVVYPKKIIIIPSKIINILS